VTTTLLTRPPARPPVPPRRPRAREVAEHIRLQVYGLAFLVAVLGLGGLSIAVYQKAFTPVVHITLVTDTIGSQLAPGADVKLRGIIVGEVRSISSDGRTARLQLALQPGRAGLVPANVSARLLPKTLFGERFVDLVLPSAPCRPIRDGDVIPQDRSASAVELQQVFDQLLPVLQTVQPAKLAQTLAAMADTLEGRGARLGTTAASLNRYLTGLQPQLPALDADISSLAQTASTYADAAPDLLRLLRNLPVTATTMSGQQTQLHGFLVATSGFAERTTAVLNSDGNRLIQVAGLNRPVLEVLARYSPQYACFLQGLQRWTPNIDQAFSGGRLHITLEVVVPRQPYRPGQQPRYEENRAPDCYGLPNPKVPAPGIQLRDGTGGGGSTSGATASGTSASGAWYPDSGSAGTAAERQVVDALLAPQYGTAAGRVPAIADLLWAPMARGTQVTLEQVPA
jgi:phospholipid/cholesterol/gamma-HCH transport system substrate-binding protein